MSSKLPVNSSMLISRQNLAQPTRKYVYEGELFIWSAEKQNKRKRVMFLFNDLLVETKPIKRSSAKSPSGHSTSFQYERCFHLYRLYPRSLPDTNSELPPPLFLSLSLLLSFLYDLTRSHRRETWHSTGNGWRPNDGATLCKHCPGERSMDKALQSRQIRN